LNLLQDTAPGLEPGLAKGSDLQLALRRIAEQAERAGKVIRSVHDFVRRRDQLREAVSSCARKCHPMHC
jgi:two-component system sensor histidine kinase DctS